jgi:hypothetical protein
VSRFVILAADGRTEIPSISLSDWDDIIIQRTGMWKEPVHEPLFFKRMSSDAKDNYDHLSLNTWYCAGEREEENEEGQFKILKWHPEDPPPPVAANSTLKSNPWFDKFFQADVDLPLKRVVTALERVRQDYFAATDPKIMIKTKEESFHDLSFSDALTFAGREAELEYFQYAPSGAGRSFNFIVQWGNRITGTNGNFRVMLGDKETNSKASKFLFRELDLREFDQAKFVVGADEMKVNPIFRGRGHALKKDLCFALMPFTESWSNDLWITLQKIVKAAGLIPQRADDLYGHDVLEDIWNAINEASTIVADVSVRNPNVFYEVGIAHTLGKRVILMTQNASDIPFDFQRYRHLIYSPDPAGLAKLEQDLPGFLKV